MASYYEVIDGLKLDRAVIDAVRKGVEGKGDGRVSVEDAKEVFEKLKDGNKVTRIERWTLRFCQTEFHWTEAAEDYIVKALEDVPQEDDDEGEPEPKEPEPKRRKADTYYETIDGVKLDKAIVDACRTAVEGKGDGRISEADAKIIYEKAADADKVTRAERWTLRYCMAKFRWTQAAEDYIYDALKKVEHEDDGGMYSDPEKKEEHSRCVLS